MKGLQAKIHDNTKKRKLKWSYSEVVALLAGALYHRLSFCCTCIY